MPFCMVRILNQNTGIATLLQHPTDQRKVLANQNPFWADLEQK